MGFENRNISWKDMLFMGHIRMLLRVGALLANSLTGHQLTCLGYYALLLSWSTSPVTPFVFCETDIFHLICWHFFINLHFTSKHLMCCISSTLWLCFYLLEFLRIEILSKLLNIFIFTFDIFVPLKKCGAWAGEMIQLLKCLLDPTTLRRSWMW